MPLLDILISKHGTDVIKFNWKVGISFSFIIIIVIVIVIMLLDLDSATPLFPWRTTKSTTSSNENNTPILIVQEPTVMCYVVLGFLAVMKFLDES